MNSALTPLAFGLAFVTVTAARSLWLRRTAGVNPYVIDHKDPLLRFVAYLFLVVALGMAGYFFSLALWPQSEQSLGLLAWAKTPATQVVSLVLMSFGVAWTGYAQFAMGNSWRIGIPAAHDRSVRTVAQPDFSGHVAVCDRTNTVVAQRGYVDHAGCGLYLDRSTNTLRGSVFGATARRRLSQISREGSTLDLMAGALLPGNPAGTI